MDYSEHDTKSKSPPPSNPYNSISKMLESLNQEVFSAMWSSKILISDEHRLEIALKLLKIIDTIHMQDAPNQRNLFRSAEKIGIHILKPHFYSVLPTVSQLPDEIWEKKYNAGINWNEEVGLSLLDELSKYSSEFKQIVQEGKFDPHNHVFGYHDSAIYYAIIRYFMPKRIIEIGSGQSTKIASMASIKNEVTSITCIDPFPPKILKDGSHYYQRLIEKPVQEIPISTFQELDENDILFIDSTHVSKIGSDVNYLLLEVLPNLKKGVLIHIHDIFLPFHMPVDWIKDLLLFWNEQYMLHAFLIGNTDFEIILPLNRIINYHRDALLKVYDYKILRGASFWIRKIR